MKSILLKILTIISPVIILATLGIMQGVWFDVEEYIERGDTDVFHPSLIQYLLYYLVSIVLFVLSWLLLKHEYKKDIICFFTSGLQYYFSIRYWYYTDMFPCSLSSITLLFGQTRRQIRYCFNDMILSYQATIVT